jgi:hypothetical protein
MLPLMVTLAGGAKTSVPNRLTTYLVTATLSKMKKD